MLSSGIKVSGFSNPAITYLGEEGPRPCPGVQLPSGSSAFAFLFSAIRSTLDRQFLLVGHGHVSFSGAIAGAALDEQAFEAEWSRWVVPLSILERYPQEVKDRAQFQLFRPGVFSAWGQAVGDDWCRMIGVGDEESRAVELSNEILLAEADTDMRNLGLAAARSLEENENLFRWLVRDRSDLMLRCIDGVAWEFSAREAEIANAFRAHALSVPGLSVEAVSSEELFAW